MCKGSDSVFEKTGIKKTDFYSIPNIICYFRILLVPLFVYVYMNAETGSDYLGAAGVVGLSALSDFLDGFIARRFNMITELGKLIDPVADKLTQFVVGIMLMIEYPLFIILVIAIVAKDSMLLFGGMYVFKTKNKHLAQAELPGKIATATFFVVAIGLIAFNIPGTPLANTLIVVTTLLMIFAMIHYGKGLYNLYYERD